MQVGILRPNLSDKAHAPADDMAVAHVKNVVIDFAADIEREPELLEGIDDGHLVVTRHEMAPATLDGGIVAVDQLIVEVVIKVIVRVSADDGKGGSRRDGLHHVE